MSDTVDKHQHQLSSLNDVHRQKVAALKASHAKSVDQLQKQLAVLQSSSAGDSASGIFILHCAKLTLLHDGRLNLV